MKKTEKDVSDLVPAELESSPPLEANSRAKLCEVARQLFAEKGLEGVSTRDLAGAAGVNVSLISYYFGGKEGLYKQVFLDFAQEAQSQLARLFSAYDEAQLSRESYVALMQGLVRAMVTFKSQNRDISKLIMREMIEGMPYAREIYETLFDSMARRVIEMLMAAQKKKIIRADIDAPLLFFSLIHTVDCHFLGSHCQTMLTQHCGQLSQDQLVDQLNIVFIEGVLL